MFANKNSIETDCQLLKNLTNAGMITKSANNVSRANNGIKIAVNANRQNPVILIPGEEDLFLKGTPRLRKLQLKKGYYLYLLCVERNRDLCLAATR